LALFYESGIKISSLAATLNSSISLALIRQYPVKHDFIVDSTVKNSAFFGQ